MNFLASGNFRSTPRRSVSSRCAIAAASPSAVATAIAFQAAIERSIEMSATLADPFQSFWIGSVSIGLS